MEDRYFQVLSDLVLRGIDIETDISDTVYRLFSDRDKLNPPSNFATEEIITRFIDVMKVNGHITYGITDGTVYKLQVIARLTAPGKDFYINHLLNIKTLNSLSVSKPIAIITLILLFISTSSTVYTCNQNIEKDKQLKSTSHTIDSLTGVVKILKAKKTK